jgi:ABC-type antimicrobial peptide transport system permease subunit
MGVVGLVIGLVGAVGATQVIKSLLFGVSSYDPATFIGVSAALIAVMLAAAYLPARRATYVDPIDSLRTQ